MQRREEGRSKASADRCFPPTLAFRFGRFETKGGIKVCAKPNAPWVKKAIKNLQKKKEPQAV